MLVPVVDGEDVIFLPGSNGDPDEEDHSNVFDRSTLSTACCSLLNKLKS